MYAPIQTIFQGNRYRSRLEARWAVFMSAMGIDFRYEFAGFTYRGVSYLPDFWLPVHKFWIEVKPDVPDADAQNKAAMLAEGTGHPVFILYGDIPSQEHDNDSAHLTISHHAGGVQSDTCYRWTQCRICGWTSFAWQGLGERLIHCGEDANCTGCDGPAAWTPQLTSAYEAARHARFEHGERSVLERYLDGNITKGNQ